MIDVMATAKKIIANVEQVIVGKRRQIILSLVSWFCEGHILLEDVPGVAKTMLARALAKSVGCSFKRIQCTPDLLPTDVTGASIFNQKSSEFEFDGGEWLCTNGGVPLVGAQKHPARPLQAKDLQCLEHRVDQPRM